MAGRFRGHRLETFPFLLPMLCAAALTSFGGALGFLYAPETASQWRRMQKRREERERATRTSLLVTTKREERGRRDVHRDGEDGDAEDLLLAAADAEGDGGLGVGPGFSEVELVRLDESGVSQAVVAEAPESRTEKAPRDAAGAKTASSEKSEAEAEDDDDETRRRGTTAANDAFSFFFSVRGRDRSVAIRDDAALRHLRQHGWDAHTIVAASSYAGLAFIAIGYDEILPVYAATTRRRHGGLSLSASQIGLVLVVGGVALILFQLFAFPLVLKRLGSRRRSPPSLAFAPSRSSRPVRARASSSKSRRRSGSRSPTTQTLKIVTLAVLFTTVIMAVNNSCLNRVKARVNGAATSCAALGRIVSPVVHGCVFRVACDCTKTRSSFSCSRSCRLRGRSSRYTSRLPSRLDQPPRRRRTSARQAQRRTRLRGSFR